MEFIELIKTPNVDGVRLLDASGRVDCQVLTVVLTVFIFDDFRTQISRNITVLLFLIMKCFRFLKMC